LSFALDAVSSTLILLDVARGVKDSTQPAHYGWGFLKGLCRILKTIAKETAEEAQNSKNNNQYFFDYRQTMLSRLYKNTSKAEK
jgi:hypothetical protein